MSATQQYTLKLTGEEIEFIHTSTKYALDFQLNGQIHLKGVGPIPSIKILADLKTKTGRLINIVNEDAN